MKDKNNQAFRAVLTTFGRKTGKEHSVMLLAVGFEGKIYFSRHRLDGDWIKNAIFNSDVKVEFDASTFLGKALLVSNENLAKKISEIKYPGEERGKERRVILQVSLN